MNGIRERTVQQHVLLRKSENVNPRRLDTFLLWSSAKQTNKEIPFYLASNSVPDSTSEIANGLESLLSDSPVLLHVARVPYGRTAADANHMRRGQSTRALPPLATEWAESVIPTARHLPLRPLRCSPHHANVRPCDRDHRHRRTGWVERDRGTVRVVRESPSFPCRPLAVLWHRGSTPSHLPIGSICPRALWWHTPIRDRSPGNGRQDRRWLLLGENSSRDCTYFTGAAFRPTSFDRAGNYWFSRKNREREGTEKGDT